MGSHRFKKYHLINPKNEGGYVLVLVIITGLILATGALIISARSMDSFLRSFRLSQKDESIEIAETGASILIEELNENFPYLLTVNCKVTNNSISEQFENPICEGWKSFALGNTGGPNSACPGRSDDPSLIMDRLYEPVLNNRGAYRLRGYEFLGDQIQGGTAIIQVQGQRLKDESGTSGLAASAIVEQEVTIIPKCCNQAPYEQCGGGGKWDYGLATQNIALQVGDVIDQNRAKKRSKGSDQNQLIELSEANVHCIDCIDPPSDKCTAWGSAGQTIGTDCEILESQIKQESDPKIRAQLLNQQLLNSGIIDGERSSGDLDIPAAPTWKDIRDENGDPLPDLTPWTIRYQSITIGHDTNSNHCVTTLNPSTRKKTTHCRIQSIDQTGASTMKLIPGDGDIRFYMEGSQINLSGIHNFVNTGNYGQFAIYGGLSTYGNNPEETCGDKQLNISGGSSIKAFLHMPCFDVNLSGGNETYPITITGSVISKNYNATGDYARLIVPDDSGNTVCSQFNVCSGRGSGVNLNNMEYSAVGSNRWNLIQMKK